MQKTAHRLNSGQEMPAIGFGTWRLEDGEEAMQATMAAIKSGYRLIDTAAIYGNEKSVGRAISSSGVPREQIFLTTKLWTSEQGYESAQAAFDESLARLGLDYVDLYLIHWPGPDIKARTESWQALTEIHKSGKAKSIGVSNFELSHLHDFMKRFDKTPSVNQIQLNPFNFRQQREVVEFCRKHNIVVEAYSPLGRGRVDHPLISKIAAQHGKTNAQVMLRWAIQHNTIPIPKSATPERIRQNLDVFDFDLSNEQMSQLDSLS